jgi:hypothetical protein
MLDFKFIRAKIITQIDIPLKCLPSFAFFRFAKAKTVTKCVLKILPKILPDQPKYLGYVGEKKTLLSVRIVRTCVYQIM